MRKSIYKFFAFPLVMVYLAAFIAYCVLQLQLPEPLWFSEFERSIHIDLQQFVISIAVSVAIYSLFLFCLKPADLYKVSLD